MRKEEFKKAENVSKPIEIDPTSDACQSAKYGRARLEPPDGKIYLGFHLNWQIQHPPEVQSILQRNPAV